MLRLSNLSLFIFLLVSIQTQAKNPIIPFKYLSVEGTIICSYPSDVCDNATIGGTISGNEDGCPNPVFDPKLITSITPASGGTGTLEYLWMFTNENPNFPSTIWTAIPNTNTETYDPGSIIITTYFIRCARRSGCTIYAVESNFIKKEIKCCPGNITDGGEIAKEQNSCVTPYNPSLLSNMKSPMGGNGPLEFQWLSSPTGGAFNNGTWTSIPNATMNTYNPPSINSTTFYVRRARVEMCNDWEYSNVVKITVGTGVAINFTPVNPTCFNSNNGIITVNVLLGQSPFMFKWSNGSMNQTINNLSSGIYSVTVTDINGCTSKGLVTLTGASEIIINGTGENPICFGGGSGKIATVVSGGAPTYTYLWSSGEITSTILNKTAGTYTVTVTDSKSCTSVKSFTLLDGQQINLTGNSINVTCFGGNNGSITTNVSGGKTPYKYKWSNSLETSSLSNLLAGTYTVTVTDDNNCIKTASFIVSQPNLLQIDGNVNNVNCFGLKTGSITTTVSGGTMPYAYSWSNSLLPIANQLNLSAGNYSVTVTDSKSCSAIKNFTISENPILNISAISTPPKCFGGQDGSVNITPTGGSGAYTYNWSNNAKTQDISGLSAGPYSVTVTDSNGCTKEITVVLQAPNNLVVSGSTGNTFCAMSKGSITLNVSGGNPAYSYKWSNSSTAKDLTNLAAGNYSVTVTDSNNCTKTSNFTVIDQGNILIQETIIQASCLNPTGGSISINITGGTAPLSVDWSSGQKNINSISNLLPGNYSVTVVDANGCIAVGNYSIQPIPVIQLSGIATSPSCHLAANGSIIVNPTNGSMPYSYVWNNNSTTNPILNLKAGTYTVTVTDSKACKQIASYILTDPNPIIFNEALVNPNCNGGKSGSITISNISGGTPGYTLIWSNGATNSSISGLGAGNYSVTITDSKACSVIKTFTLNEGANLQLNVSKIDIKCFGQTNGSISITPTGGISPYNFFWSPVLSNSGTVNNLSAGNYSVTVTDVSGCTATSTTAIISPTNIITTLTPSNIKCFGDSNGGITSNVSGGTAPYTYLWSNNATSSSISGLNSGTYSVTVTDANNCTKIVSIILSNPDKLNLSTISNDLICPNSTTGFITITVLGGTPGYTFLWSNGSTSKDLNNIGAGTYSITVTDKSGCTVTKSLTINQPIPIDFALNKMDQNCLGLADGKISISNLIGGTPGYSYIWSTGSVASSISNILPGIYSVTVTDSKGCSVTKSIEIIASTKKCSLNIGDYVWIDTDKDGIQDANEMGVNGIVVHLIECGADGIFGTGDDIIVDTESTKNIGIQKGYYLFKDVKPGTYTIMFFIDQDKYVFTGKDKGGNDELDSDPNPATGKTDKFTIKKDDNDNLSFDAGIYQYCDNVTTGGVICCNETICKPGTTPTVITSVSPASGGSGGLIEYLWLYSTSDPNYTPLDPDWIEIPNSNAPSYQPGNIFVTTYYIRCAKRKDCKSYAGESNIIIKKVVNGKDAVILTTPTPICNKILGSFTALDQGPNTSYDWHFGSGALPQTGSGLNPSTKWNFGGMKNIKLTVSFEGCVTESLAMVQVYQCTNSIQIINFDAKLNEELKTDLAWQINGDSESIFEIQRSQDSLNFITINAVNLKPNSDGWSFITDPQPSMGKNFYRIRLISNAKDNDFSNIRSINITDAQLRPIIAYPNPVQNTLWIEQIGEVKKNSLIEISDTYGRIMKSIDLQSNFSQFEIPMNDLQAGLYFVKVKINGRKTYTFTISKVD